MIILVPWLLGPANCQRSSPLPSLSHLPHSNSLVISNNCSLSPVSISSILFSNHPFLCTSRSTISTSFWSCWKLWSIALKHYSMSLYPIPVLIYFLIGFRFHSSSLASLPWKQPQPPRSCFLLLYLVGKTPTCLNPTSLLFWTLLQKPNEAGQNYTASADWFNFKLISTDLKSALPAAQQSSYTSLFISHSLDI